MDEDSIFILSAPKEAGYYYIGKEYQFRIAQMEKPNLIHRFFMKILLGFAWENAPEPPTGDE